VELPVCRAGEVGSLRGKDIRPQKEIQEQESKIEENQKRENAKSNKPIMPNGED